MRVDLIVLMVMLAVVAGCADTGTEVDAGTGADASISTEITTSTGVATDTTTGTSTDVDDDVTDLPSAEVEAIIRLGSTDAGPPPEHDHDMMSGGHQARPVLDEAEAQALDAEVAAARSVIADLDTVDEAAALGYVLATAPSPGIGTHWVRWSQIEQPFDPRTPAMLLFDHTRTPPELVGFSYTLQSGSPPTGFTGDSDHWHRHTGLCVSLDGWVVRERARGPEACDGSFIAGGDFWMLHAWIVPGWSNRDGLFAPRNPKLCPSAAGTPEYRRCEEA